MNLNVPLKLGLQMGSRDTYFGLAEPFLVSVDEIGLGEGVVAVMTTVSEEGGRLGHHHHRHQRDRWGCCRRRQ